MWEQPIFDRVRADVDLIRLDPTNTNTKGALNYFDLNRIEGNCSFLVNWINESGFFTNKIQISIKNDWNVSDIPTIDDINRIRNNILTIRDSIFEMEEFELIEFTNTLDYIKVNIIEKDLYLIKTMLDKVKMDMRYCNTFSCGCDSLEW